MDREHYISEAERQLNDSNFYTSLDHDPTLEYAKQVSDVVGEMLTEGLISEKNFNYLLVDQPKAGRFYLCPKSIKLATLVPHCLCQWTSHGKDLGVCGSASATPCSKSTVLLTGYYIFFEETRCPWSVAPKHPPGLHGCNFALHQHTTPRWYPSLRRSLGNTDKQRPTNRNPDQTPYTCFEV